MQAVMQIALARLSCPEDQAEVVAQAHADLQRRRGLRVAFHRAVWREGVVVIAIHHRGWKRRPVLTPAVAMRVQSGATPSLFAGVA